MIINTDTEFHQIPDYPNYEINIHGTVRNKLTGLILRVQRYPNGYYYFHLFANSIPKSCLRHRLLMLTFKLSSEKDSQLDVNHINGVKGDDRIENLEWVTKRENCEHAGEMGLSPKCTPLQVLDVATGKICIFPSATACAKVLGFTKDMILWRLRKGENRVFPEGKRYRRGLSEHPWDTVDVIDSAQCYLHQGRRAITLIDIFSNEVFEFKHIGIAATFLKRSTMSLAKRLCQQRWVVVPEGFFVRYSADVSADDKPEITIELLRNNAQIEILNTVTNELKVYPSITAATLMCKMDRYALLYKVASRGKIVFTDECRYGYFSDLTQYQSLFS